MGLRAVSPARLLSLCLSLVVSTILSGCSQEKKATVSPAAMAKHGAVHGGQQPVSGATIQLYAVGTTGDGSSSTPLLTETVTTDSAGGFSITNDYTCPLHQPWFISLLRAAIPVYRITVQIQR
jgi:hypothetical protein